ncbi:hypothetical protein SADUNF_Sadunf16G0158000 [Salix dunnii]|uniref:Uncharacterized protein n=1 Tax=Salix dunnii TaxID=1413687 RepID=A0A835MGN0_9ROSI|nr:hypothetical protein SADUNF_Sadunf16G0158000 [Salix dunnii]
MALEISNCCFFSSAPTTPGGFNPEDNVCFYSAPTSPAKGTSDLESKPTTPKTYEDANSNLDDFEFETSRRFNTDEIDLGDSMRYEDAMEEQRKSQRQQYKESFPAMAFADELFRDGKVIPLKPPPCHQYAADGKFDNHSSTPTSPESQMAKLKIPFPRRNVWNDDFDPFMVALKTVKGERKGKWQKINHTRARSMSPIRARSGLMDSMNKQCKQLDPIRPNLNNQLELNGLSTRVWIQNVSNASPKGPEWLAESKGVLFARKARLMKIDPEWPGKPNKITLQEPMVKAGENAKEKGEPSERKSKRQRMKNFLYRSLSMRRNDDHSKQTEQTGQVSKPKFKRKLSFESMGLVARNGVKGGSQITKEIQTRCKPKLSLCMSYGAKYAE